MSSMQIWVHSLMLMNWGIHLRLLLMQTKALALHLELGIQVGILTPSFKRRQHRSCSSFKGSIIWIRECLQVGHIGAPFEDFWCIWERLQRRYWRICSVGSVATSHAEDTKTAAAESDDMALFGDRSLFEWVCWKASEDLQVDGSSLNPFADEKWRHWCTHPSCLPHPKFLLNTTCFHTPHAYVPILPSSLMYTTSSPYT